MVYSCYDYSSYTIRAQAVKDMLLLYLYKYYLLVTVKPLILLGFTVNAASALRPVEVQRKSLEYQCFKGFLIAHC